MCGGRNIFYNLRVISVVIWTALLVSMLDDSTPNFTAIACTTNSYVTPGNKSVKFNLDLEVLVEDCTELLSLVLTAVMSYLAILGNPSYLGESHARITHVGPILYASKDLGALGASEKKTQLQ